MSLVIDLTWQQIPATANLARLAIAGDDVYGRVIQMGLVDSFNANLDMMGYSHLAIVL